MATSGTWFHKIVSQKTVLPDRISIDLSGVTDVDSSALAFVASLRRVLSEAGHEVEWVNVPANVHDVAAIYEAETIFVLE